MIVMIQFAYGCTNFVGGIAASRPHRRTDSTVRPTPGTARLMYEYSWYEVPYWYEYLLPATYPALPCPALPCPALPCPALPCPALPCPDPLALTCYNLS